MPEVMTPKARGKVKSRLPVFVNLAAWYRYRIGLTNVSGACSAWADSSNNARPLLQATATNRPAILSDGSILFDGSDNYLQATFTLIQPLTIYLAFQQQTWTSGDIIFDGVTGDVRVAQNTSTPGLAANAGSGLTVDNTIPVSTLNYGVLAFVANATSSVYQAGGGSASVTTTGDAGANNAGGITLGASRTPGNYANIAVKEMAVYSVAHDAPTRLAILRYFARIANVGGV